MLSGYLPPNKFGFSHLKQLNLAIKNNLGQDISDFRHSIIIARTNAFIAQLSNEAAENFIYCNFNDKKTLERLISWFYVKDDELFRDPSFWRTLKNEVLQVLNLAGEIRILLPEAITIYELWSLMITVYECNLTDKVKVTTTRTVDEMSVFQEELTPREFEVAKSNYTRFMGQLSLDNYFDTNEKGNFVLKKSYLKNVNSIVHNIKEMPLLNDYHLVLYRNKGIYFSQDFFDKSITNITKSSLMRGYLAIGTKENITRTFKEKSYKAIDLHEKIYQKLRD